MVWCESGEAGGRIFCSACSFVLSVLHLTNITTKLRAVRSSSIHSSQCLLISHNIYVLHSGSTLNLIELLPSIYTLTANRYSFNTSLLELPATVSSGLCLLGIL